MARRASDRFFELCAFLQIGRKRTDFTECVDRFLVLDARLPGAELCESANPVTHAPDREQERCHTRIGSFLEQSMNSDADKEIWLRGKYAGTANLEPRTSNPEPEPNLKPNTTEQRALRTANDKI